MAIILNSERVDVSNRAVPIGRRVLDAEELTLRPILLRFRNVRRMVDILDEVPLAELFRWSKGVNVVVFCVVGLPLGSCIGPMRLSGWNMFALFACFYIAPRKTRKR